MERLTPTWGSHALVRGARVEGYRLRRSLCPGAHPNVPRMRGHTDGALRVSDCTQNEFGSVLYLNFPVIGGRISSTIKVNTRLFHIS